MNNPLINTNIKPIFAKRLSLVFIGFILVFFGVVSETSAASLYFSPSSGSYNVGQTFSVNVYVSSIEQAMNAASGAISFPSDKLEVVSLSKNGSIFTLWVQEPTFSNSIGNINFEGIVFNPGFTGAAGKIITLNFKVKTVGVALLSFSSGSVLANDGEGTNILASLGNAQFNLEYAIRLTPEVAPLSLETPAAPKISSPTHPDPNKWYSKDTAKFTWSVPAGVTAARLLYDEQPRSQPRVVYEPAISEKEISGLKDGIYYFHVQLKNNKGWGAISHFRFQIDTQPPAPFEIKFIDGKETDNPRPAILFEARDALSGIDYYQIKIDDGEFFTVDSKTLGDQPYILPLQLPGKKTILIRAYDKAGNYTTASEEFTITLLKSPVITEYPQRLTSDEFLTIKGKTQYPNSRVIIWIQKEKKDAQSQAVKTDQDGNFIFTPERKMEDGIYKLWAEVVDERGVKSKPSGEITIFVERPAILKIGSWVINLLAATTSLILGFMVWHIWRKLFRLKKEIRKEVYEAEETLHNTLVFLREEIWSKIKMLEKAQNKRQLTKEEKNIFNQLKMDLEVIEKVVKKEIEDIEKEIK